MSPLEAALAMLARRYPDIGADDDALCADCFANVHVRDGAEWENGHDVCDECASNRLSRTERALTAALAEVDRLTRTLACERGEWASEQWTWNPDQRGYVRQQPRLWACVRRFTHQRREGWGWDWEIEWRDSRAGGAGCRIDETRYRYGIEAIEAADAAIAGAS